MGAHLAMLVDQKRCGLAEVFLEGSSRGVGIAMKGQQAFWLLGQAEACRVQQLLKQGTIVAGKEEGWPRSGLSRELRRSPVC